MCGCAIALQGFSLLKFDILSGIVFATPVAPLILGMTSRRPSGPLAITAIGAGLVAGVTTYLASGDPELDYFYGNLVSLFVPFLVVGIGSVFTSHRYDFQALAGYRSHHQASLAGAEHKEGA